MEYKAKLRRNILLYYLSSFFSALIFIVPVWVSFERHFLNYTQMALLDAFAVGITLVFEIPTGALADLIGRKKTVLLGWGMRALGNMYIAFSTNAEMLIVGFVVTSIGNALISGADSALLYDSLKELGEEKRFSKVMSINGLLFQIGLAIATFVGGYLYKFWIGLPYFLYGLAELCTTALFLFSQEPFIRSTKFNLQSYFKQTRNGFREIFKNLHIRDLSIFYVLVGGITWSSQYFFIQTFASDLGFSEIEKSWIFAAIRIINGILLFRLVSIDKILTRKRTYYAFPLLMVIAFLPGMIANKFIGIMSIFIASFLSSARFTILGQYLNDEFDSKYRATAISSLSMLVNVGYVIIVLISSLFINTYTTKAAFTFLGILSLILVLPRGIKLVKRYHLDN